MGTTSAPASVRPRMGPGAEIWTMGATAWGRRARHEAGLHLGAGGGGEDHHGVASGHALEPTDGEGEIREDGERVLLVLHERTHLLLRGARLVEDGGVGVDEVGRRRVVDAA